MVELNFTPPLSAIATPTRIVHGDRDEFFPVNIAVHKVPAQRWGWDSEGKRARSSPVARAGGHTNGPLYSREMRM